MSFTSMGLIYLGTGTEDPAVHRAVIEHGGLRTTIVAVPNVGTVVDVAVEMAEGGTQMIELCGAFGPVWTARVIDAVGPHIPVGAVTYGMESVHAVAELFPQAATV